MMNDRPISDPHLQAALHEVAAISRKYDLAGAAMLVSADEAAYTYPLYTTWNAVVEDATTPMGFRIRVSMTDQGQERAQSLLLGTAHLFCQLKDFGIQTQRWMEDFLRLMRRQGVNVTHQRFNGRRLGRIEAMPRKNGD